MDFEYLNKEAVMKETIIFKKEFPIIEHIDQSLLGLKTNSKIDEQLINELHSNGILVPNKEFSDIAKWLTNQKVSLLKKFIEYKQNEIHETLKRIADKPILYKGIFDYSYKADSILQSLLLLLNNATYNEVMDYLLSCKTYAKDKFLFEKNDFSRASTEETLFKKLLGLLKKLEIEKNPAPVRKVKEIIPAYKKAK